MFCLFKPPGPYGEPAFVSTVFRDWKHARWKKGVFADHESSRIHEDCMFAYEQFKANVEKGCTIGERLSNRQYVKCLPEVALVCAL